MFSTSAAAASGPSLPGAPSQAVAIAPADGRALNLLVRRATDRSRDSREGWPGPWEANALTRVDIDLAAGPHACSSPISTTTARRVDRRLSHRDEWRSAGEACGRRSPRRWRWRTGRRRPGWRRPPRSPRPAPTWPAVRQSKARAIALADPAHARRPLRGSADQLVRLEGVSSSDCAAEAGDRQSHRALRAGRRHERRGRPLAGQRRCSRGSTRRPTPR